MAATLDIDFCFGTSMGFPRPDVRIWIDGNNDGQMADKEEVLLQPDPTRPHWTGSFALSVDKTTGIGFIVTYTTNVPNHWQLTIKSGGNTVFDGQGELKRDTNGFLLGKCS
jgi:hypothetical protein